MIVRQLGPQDRAARYDPCPWLRRFDNPYPPHLRAWPGRLAWPSAPPEWMICGRRLERGQTIASPGSASPSPLSSATLGRSFLNDAVTGERRRSAAARGSISFSVCSRRLSRPSATSSRRSSLVRPSLRPSSTSARGLRPLPDQAGHDRASCCQWQQEAFDLPCWRRYDPPPGTAALSGAVLNGYAW